MSEYSGSNRKKTAWCPLTETLQTTLTEPSSGYAPVLSVQPDGGGNGAGRRIGRGAGIASRSIKILINNRKLLWYPLLAGLALFLMYLTEMAFKAYAIMTCSGSYGYWSLGYHYGFVLTFVVELIFFFCLNYIFAATVIDISKNPENPGAVRKSLYSAKNYLKTIAGWSVILAVVATAIYAFVLQQPWHAHLYPALGTTMFQIPFVYYVPILPLATITAVIEKILYTVPLLVITLYVIPLLVLENRNLSGAIGGLAGFFRRTWIEIVVCSLIFATIVVGITLLSPLICMTPMFVDYDYHFFAAYAIPMAAVCFIFLALLWTAAASVFTTTGIAAVDLYKLGKK
ncbi:hypothetical protein [Methanolacinia petrolearia]|uniref:hypothetical protein n=1 Tax=Methanolacinia petrolearia TaxID=54120 RepID=UPI003BAB8EB9